MTFRLLLSSSLLAIPALAQDGGQLYTLYCSACHGADGKGATGGALPPLAASPWVAGDPDRAVKVILHGLHGPVDVLGKTYNLEMPPQGGMLPDDQIAAVLSHVRSSWGNQAAAVSADFVKSIRAANSERNQPWTASELLKLHPLPLEKTALTNLTSQVYAGTWSSLPDFSKLKAENAEEEHDGVISIADSPLKESFAMVWQAGFQAPADGDYTFLFDADDAGKVIINGKTLSEIGGSGPMDGSRSKQGEITLKQGSHPFRVEYLEITGQEGITIGWKGPGVKTWRWLTDTTGASINVREPIPIAPVGGRPVVYRNFIEGAGARAIGIGFPGGLNLAYSADFLGPALIWTGDFIDGSAKWLDRGTDSSPPAGENLVKLLASRSLPENARFRGYKLDAAGNPVFSIQLGDQFLLDSWRAETNSLVRKLSLSGSSPLTLRVSDQASSDPITVEVQGGALQTTGGQFSLSLTPGQAVTLTYRWK
jgi:mono/diheme cytochrome c family protein